MGKLVLELQRDAMDECRPVSALLRKALVVAKKLQVTEFESWISSEINGYSPGVDISEYRKVFGNIKAWSPYNGWIPIVLADAAKARVHSQMSIGQAIGSLESLVAGNESSTLQVRFLLR